MARPRGIVPMVPVLPAAPPTVPRLQNPDGGTVLASVEVIPIYWGAYWHTAPGIQLSNDLDAFFDFILTSSLMDLLSEYSTATTLNGRGRRPSSRTVSESEPGTATAGGGREVTDVQIQAALLNWIANGTIPATTSNTLYFVYLPPDVVSFLGALRSCVDHCGYHEQIDKSVFYAVGPYITCAGCSAGTILESLTKMSSHELAEAVTDPAVDAWRDPNTGFEIGDICTPGAKGSDPSAFSTRLGGFLVQSQWSNSQGKCVIAPPTYNCALAQKMVDFLTRAIDHLDEVIIQEEKDGVDSGPAKRQRAEKAAERLQIGIQMRAHGC